MSAPRLNPARSSVRLPETSALEGLDTAELLLVAERAAALHAGAMARLAFGRTVAPPPSSAADEYLTAEQVAQRLNADVAWVYRHGRQGKIP